MREMLTGGSAIRFVARRPRRAPGRCGWAAARAAHACVDTCEIQAYDRGAVGEGATLLGQTREF